MIKNFFSSVAGSVTAVKNSIMGSKILRFFISLIIAAVSLVLILILFLLFSWQGADASDKGLDPGVPILFLFDRSVELTQQFFTFGAKSQIDLQARFAGERLSEISTILRREGMSIDASEGGPQAGYKKAQELFSAHIAKIADILAEETAKGKNTKQLAQEAADIIEVKEAEAEMAIGKELDSTREKNNYLIQEIQSNFGVGGKTRADKLVEDFRHLDTYKKIDLFAGAKANTVELAGNGEEKISAFLDPKVAAEKLAKRIEDEKESFLINVVYDNITLPQDEVAKLQADVSGTKNFFDQGDYEGVKKSAKSAGGKIDILKQKFEDMKKDSVSLTVKFVGTGGGSFNTKSYNGGFVPSGGSFDCQKHVCRGKYERGAIVVITPNPLGGSKFEEWGSECYGKSDCFVVLDSDKSVDLNFATIATYKHPALGFSIDYPDALTVETPSASNALCAVKPCLVVFRDESGRAPNYIIVLGATILKGIFGTSAMTGVEKELDEDVGKGEAVATTINDKKIYQYINNPSKPTDAVAGFSAVFGFPPESVQSFYAFTVKTSLVIFGVQNPPADAPDFNDYADIKSLVTP